MDATKSQQTAPQWIPGPASALFDDRPEGCIDRKPYMPTGSVERYEGKYVAFAVQAHVLIDVERLA